MALAHDQLLHDTRATTADEMQSAPHAPSMRLDEIVPLLASPDSGRPLVLKSGVLTDGEHTYHIAAGSPVLYPAAAATILASEIAPLIDGSPLQQYFALSKLRQMGEITASPHNVHAQRHFFRMRSFVSELEGTVLDVGCDDVALSKSLYPPECHFIGLDPFAQAGQFRVIGVGERLPFKSDSLTNVIFNTSLDHILDYHEALEEAYRVLRPRCYLTMCTLIWTAGATLLTDSVHFHHFREHEIYGSLSEIGFSVVEERRYSYKDDAHRFGLYLKARK